MPFRFPLSFRRRRLMLGLVAALVGATALTRYMHWDDRALVWFGEQQLSQEQRAASIWLPSATSCGRNC